MRGDLFALFLLVCGLAFILAWAVCQSFVALRSNRLRRASDAIKMHLIKGGRMPDGEPRELARDYFHLRWLGILGNLLLVAGIIILLLAQMLAL
ncbi:MAG: hypothetical protein OEN23_17095 [Paracoccaceae bacterium]|nr:hypothetical protein [Paracoccaceae bacterium]